ncbi:tetratricopeptide repeat protein [Streptomyces sp. NPDC048473]|uniref:tetratricopeptide repeat protein n=1 Tax=unclassified Streptomyces TaxID=2593676 RepID=UPI003713C2F0
MTPLWPGRRNDEVAAEEAVPAHRQDADGPREVTVGDGGVGAGRDVSHNAMGQGSQVVDNRQTHIHHHTPREVTWPLEIGAIPSLASAFQPRAALRDQVNAAHAQGATTVLTQVLSGGGGVGKSQLAAAYAAEALHDGTDLVLWVPAAEVQQVVALYAQAAILIACPGATGKDPEQDARSLLSWLATTDRRWLVVLDDITDPTGMAPWWPASRTGTGWVLATTRLHDASLTGNGRRRVRVDVYTPQEAAVYLRTRITDDDAGHLLDDSVDDLAAVLGYLPLALGHAAAYMLNQDLTCTQYLTRFDDNTRSMEHVLPETADAEGYGRQIATTLLLSLDAAQHTEPVGLARPALLLAAHLDPVGHPHTLWTTPAVLAHLTDHRASPPADVRPGEPVTAEHAEAALRVLHRYALISSDRRQECRAVRIHALTARAVRETTPANTLHALAQAAADALMHIWPDPDQPDPGLAAALRSNTDLLHRHTGDHLWHPEGHPALFRASESLLDAGLTSAGIVSWQELAAISRRILSPEHANTLSARHYLAISYAQAGRLAQAIPLIEAVLADRERLLGTQHTDTLTTRGNLASAFWQAGRTDEAITLAEAVLADRERLFGTRHPDTLSARNNLASALGQAGRTDEAITLQEAVLADREQILGHHHPDTLATRHSLAGSYGEAGRTHEALALAEAVLADSEQVLGHHHPDTLVTRSNLALAYGEAGRTDEAITLQEAVLADREQILGHHHPATLIIRTNLASSYGEAGRTDEAITLQEAVLADSEQLLGPRHPHTLVARNNLAFAYGEAGRTDEALTLLEVLLTERERARGPLHPDTLITRHNLALAYWEVGRTVDAITLLETLVVDSAQVLGPHHPDTLNVRHILSSVYHQAGRTDEAITLQEAALADLEHLLGPDHSNLLSARNIFESYRHTGP